MTKKKKKEKYIEEIKGVIQEHLIHADWLDVDQSPTACASCPPRLLLILYNAANLTMIECLSRQLYCTVAQNAYVTNLLLDCACIYTESRVICQRAPICRSVLFFFLSPSSVLGYPERRSRIPGGFSLSRRLHERGILHSDDCLKY